MSITAVRTVLVALVGVALWAPAPAAAVHAPGLTLLNVDGEQVKILRDDFGVPRIFAESDRGLFHAFGYTAAQDRLWQLEVFRRTARGRLAEAFGPGFVASDVAVRTVGYTEDELLAQFSALPADERARFQAYADGINRHLAEVKADALGKLPLEFWALGLLPPQHPEPWTITDSVAFGAFAIRRFGEIGGRELRNQDLLTSLIASHGARRGFAIFNDVRWINDPDSPVTIPTRGAVRTPVRRGPRPSFHPGQLQGAGTPLDVSFGRARAAWKRVGAPTKFGSYAWAVAPRKSTTHGAMLYGGPQLGFDTPSLVHEVQLTGGDAGWSATGMAFPGLPGILIGRNDRLTWTSTTGVGDNLDIYVEALCDAGGGPTSGYLFDGACRPFEARTEVIDVRGGGPVTTPVLRSIHGPVVGLGGGFAITQKRAHWKREMETALGFVELAQARNLREFEEAVGRVITSHNFLYADRLGNIAYWQAGEVPIRPAGFDPRLPLPGTGEAEWPGGVLPTPSSVNPARGWLANWNNKPSVGFDNADEDIFGKQFRVLEIDERLSPGGKIRPADLADIPKDIGRVKSLGREARFLLPYLLDALAEVGSSHPSGDAARAVLEAWDWNAIADAISSTTLQPGEVIFSAWLDRTIADTFGDELGAEAGEASSNMLVHALDDALGRGSGVPPSRDYFDGADPAAVMAGAFDATLSSLEATFGTPDPTAWTPPRDEIVFQHPVLGIEVGSIPNSNRATYAQIVAYGGRSGRFGVRAQAIHPLGQSGFIHVSGTLDANWTDQLPLFRNFEYKPMPLVPEP